MLTHNQIKQLKRGDLLVLAGKVHGPRLVTFAGGPEGLPDVIVAAGGAERRYHMSLLSLPTANDLLTLPTAQWPAPRVTRIKQVEVHKTAVSAADLGQPWSTSRHGSPGGVDQT